MFWNFVFGVEVQDLVPMQFLAGRQCGEDELAVSRLLDKVTTCYASITLFTLCGCIVRGDSEEYAIIGKRDVGKLPKPMCHPVAKALNW
eukprot:2866173-Amphidinium_carterae.1